MKIFDLFWDIKDKDGNQKKERSIGEDIADAFKNAGCGGGAIRVFDYYEIVPSVTMAEIAEKLGLPIVDTIKLFRGLLGRPKLGKNLFEGRTDNPDENLVPNEDAEEFIRRVREHLSQTATA